MLVTNGTVATEILSAQAFNELEEALGFPLPIPARQYIETGLARAEIHRLVSISKAKAGRAVYEDIEVHAAGLERALRNALATPHMPLWLLYLGGSKQLRSQIFAELNPRVLLAALHEGTQILNRGARSALTMGRKGRGESKRTDRQMLYAFIVEGLSAAASWPEGQHDPKALARFARALYPYLPKSVAPRSANALADALGEAFNRPELLPPLLPAGKNGELA